MSALDRVMMQKGRITQAFKPSVATFLETRGWVRVGKARAKELGAKPAEPVTEPASEKTPAKPDAAKQRTTNQSKSEDS